MGCTVWGSSERITPDMIQMILHMCDSLGGKSNLGDGRSVIGRILSRLQFTNVVNERINL